MERSLREAIASLTGKVYGKIIELIIRTNAVQYNLLQHSHLPLNIGTYTAQTIGRLHKLADTTLAKS